MNNTMKLAYAMNHCPPAWINFFDECCANGPKDEKGDVTVEYINQQLKPWQGKYNESSESLVFETDGALSWFYLRWA